MTVNKEVYTGTRSIFLSSLPMMENRLSAYLFSDGIFNDRILGNSIVNDSKNDFNPLMIDLLKSAVPKIERYKVGLYKDSALKGNRVLKDYNGSMDGYA
ncbi:hypothetical protein, partial [Psychrobacter immobilis]